MMLILHWESSKLIDQGNGQKTGYSVGIYAEGTTVENKAGRTITVGEDGVGMYVKRCIYYIICLQKYDNRKRQQSYRDICR